MSIAPTQRKVLARGLGVSFLVFVLLGCDQTKFSTEITVPMFQNFEVRLPSFVAPGTPIPDKYSQMDVLVCEIPAEDEIWGMAEEKMGWIATFAESLFAIESLDLLDSQMVAITGTFDSITSVKLTFKPKLLDGAEQAWYELGSAASPTGLGTNILLTPPEPVDLFQVMRDEDENPSEDCARVGTEVHGFVPDGLVAADVYVHVRVTLIPQGGIATFLTWLVQPFM